MAAKIFLLLPFQRQPSKNQPGTWATPETPGPAKESPTRTFDASQQHPTWLLGIGSFDFNLLVEIQQVKMTSIILAFHAHTTHAKRQLIHWDVVVLGSHRSDGNPHKMGPLSHPAGGHTLHLFPWWVYCRPRSLRFLFGCSLAK